MSLNSANKIETNLYELKIGIDAETFGAAVNRVYKKQAKNITVPGFRKGKAPRSIIEKMYGKGVFYEDAINDLIPTVYPEALKESGIDAVSQPEFDIEEISENGVILIARVYVKPEVSIEGYKGIEVTRTVEKTTDDEVNAEIDRVRERNSRMIDVTDRAAQLGDTANIDYEGFVDGVAFDGGKAEGSDLILGSGQFIPGFEDQIVGHNIGDEFDVNVTFPEEYHAENLKGQPAVFKVKLHEISTRELPVADDEFAKEVSEFDTLGELKADIAGKLASVKEKRANDAFENALIDGVIANMEGEIPAEMFEARVDEMMADFEQRLSSQGLGLDMYLQYTGMTKESMRETFKEQATKQVKIALALEKIVEMEGIEVSDEEINAEAEAIAAQYEGVDVEQVKLVLGAQLKNDAAQKKAVELIKSTAVAPDAE